jgi:DNA-binding MarR family transcriptional regulator
MGVAAQHKDYAYPSRQTTRARLTLKLLHLLVIEHLQRADGATIVDLTQATGWLRHTTRAALTGLRKRGYAVIRERVGAGGSVYRISDAHADRRDRAVLQPDAKDGRGPKRKVVQAA